MNIENQAAKNLSTSLLLFFWGFLFADFDLKLQNINLFPDIIGGLLICSGAILFIWATILAGYFSSLNWAKQLLLVFLPIGGAVALANGIDEICGQKGAWDSVFVFFAPALSVSVYLMAKRYNWHSQKNWALACIFSGLFGLTTLLLLPMNNHAVDVYYINSDTAGAFMLKTLILISLITGFVSFIYLLYTIWKTRRELKRL
jgi:hypothetical protein